MACPHHPAAALREGGREGEERGEEQTERVEEREDFMCARIKHDKLQQNVKFLQNCSTIKSMCTSIAALY